jgi:hypothetical protein
MPSATSRTPPPAGPYPLPPALHADAAIDAFRDACRALDGAPLDVLSVEPAVLVANVRAGVDAVRPRLAEVLTARQRTDVDAILSLPNLARAVEHAAANCVAAPRVTRAAIDARYDELQTYREPALLVARGLAAPRVARLPAALVAAITQGRGIYNHAHDGVRLASLYRDHAAEVAGRHPFDDAFLDAMQAHGAWLMERVAPSGARVRRRSPPTMAAMRDRLWTLVRRRHAELRRAGIELFGEDGVNAHVPRLGLRAKAA